MTPPDLARTADTTHQHFDALIKRAQQVPLQTCAVAHPCDASSLSAALDAHRLGLFKAILVGPTLKIESIAQAEKLDLSDVRILDTPHSQASATAAVAEVRAGRATPLFITDAAINLFPDLTCKADIVQNAIDLHIGLGLGEPRVAILSAVEEINRDIPSTIEAAALCKMAERGQIRGGVLDGPLALDNAISPEAARIKGLHSAVAGRAQILVVPDLEAGNMLAKNLTFLSGALAAGVVIGARVPIILTSRADSAQTRLASCAVATIYAHHLSLSSPLR